MKTTVAIIGGGPSGLLLSYLLHKQNIDNIVLEHRSRSHVEGRIRAGQLDHSSVTFLKSVGLGTRLEHEGLPQLGINLRFNGKTHHIDLEEHTDGCHCTIYGQSELTKDIIAMLVDRGNSPVFEAIDLKLPQPSDEDYVIRYFHKGTQKTLHSKFIIGCDGAHGPCREAIVNHYPSISKIFPFGWIGLLSETSPISNQLTYAYHEQGFALWSMRSKKLSRTYLQCDENDRIEDWTDDRFWSEMRIRIGDVADQVMPGRTLERVKVSMRGAVASKFRIGNMILAGDSAHIVPPSAAKGLNMAISDISLLSKMLIADLSGKDKYSIDKYEVLANQHAWFGQQFSWAMTDLLHASPIPCTFDNNLKLARLSNLVTSPEYLRQFCKSYVGA